MNEVLRRKLFNKVMNANQPAGILASSPKMVETVQRRAHGGYHAPTSNILSNALRSVRGLPAIRQAGDTSGAGMPEFTSASGGTSMQRQSQMGDAIFGGIDTPEYFRFLESIKDLPYEQQVKALREAGYGATIGSKIEDTSSIFSNPDAPDVGILGAVKDGKAISLQELLGGTGEVARPKTTGTQTRTASGLDSLLGPEFKSTDPRTDAAMAVSSPGTGPTLNQGDPRYRPGTVPSASYGEDIVDDEYSTGVPQTQGELIVPVSGGDTQSKVSADSSPKTAAGALQSIFSGVAKKSDVTTAFESDIKNINDAFLTGVTENRSAVIDAEDRLKKATDVFDAAFSKERAKGKEFSLEDVRDEALKISGIDKKDYDENRKDAFWMGLMRAGLGIAAGESENTLTNVAKGLGFGLEGYGKDIATLNAQEREDRKELRAISMDLIKTKNDKSMAEAAAENDFNYNQQRIAQASVQGADAALLQAQNREASHKLTGLQLDANLSYQLNSLKQKDNQLAADKAYKEWALKVSMLPDEAKQVMMIDGYGFVDPETGMFKVSPEGEEYYKKLLTASTSTGYKVTDLDKAATGQAAVGAIFGVKLSDDPIEARNQALYWTTTFQDAYNKTAGESLNGPQLRKELLETFAKDIASPTPAPQTPIDLTSN